MDRFVIAGSTLCVDCHTCEAACSETHCQHDLQSMPRLRVMLNERESMPQLCHRCEDVLYTVACPVNIITRVDGAVQPNESLCVNCELCGITYPFDTIEFPGSRPLDISTNANTPKAPPAPPAPTHVSTLLDWVSGIRAIAIRCSLCSFDEQGPACVRVCPTKAPYLVNNTDITRVSKYKRELTFNTDFDDLTLFQQTQSGEVR